MLETLEAGPLSAACPLPALYNSKVKGRQQNKVGTGEATRRMGRTRRDEPTRELRRFSQLIVQLERDGISQTEIAQRTGIKMSYLNQIRNYERYGKTGIGAEHVRLAMSGLKVDPSYFFDELEVEPDYKLYLLSAKRDEKRVSAIESAVAASQQKDAVRDIEFAQLRKLLLDQTQDLAEVRAELRKALDARPSARRPVQPAGRAGTKTRLG